MYRKTYVEIDLDNLYDNVKNLINEYNEYDYYFGVVKGSCYGHGEYCVNTLIEAGINYLAISSLEEALRIRKYNNTIPILCLEPINLEFIDICEKNNITITIHDYDYFKELIKMNINAKIKVHLKIDSGMNRLGLKDKNEIKEICEFLVNNEKILLEGIYTHFGTSGLYDKCYDNQISSFLESTSLIDLKIFKIVHLDKSITMIAHPKLSFANGARLGIIMYGYNQLHKPNISNLRSKLRQLKKEYRKKKLNVSETFDECIVPLKPSYKLISEVIQVKKIKKGEHVGYGEIYTAEKDCIVAVVPIGYADGFSLENAGRYVLINKKRYKIIDIVMMGMIILEVDENVHVHDKVILIGDEIKLIEVSMHNHSTQHETLCRANSNIPRVYIKNNEIVYIQE